MSNTQKNWNDFWDNYEPSRNDIAYKNMSEKENHSNFGFSHIIIAFCITITIGCIILIAAALNDKEEPLQTTTKKTTETTTMIHHILIHTSIYQLITKWCNNEK